MPNLLENFQEIVKNTTNSMQLANVIFGTVTSTSPLKIQVEQKLELTEEFLVLTKNVTDYSVDITLNNWSTDSTSLNANHTHTSSSSSSFSVSSEIEPNENEQTITNTVSGDVNVSIESVSINLTHNHSLSGTKSITVHNELSVGDKVTLIQQSGGQKFVVLDKVY